MRVEFTNATELTNTDVDFVALVKRGANRRPFKITKGDDEVGIDLYKIGRTILGKSEASPRVVAIIAKQDTPIVLMQKLSHAVKLGEGSVQKAEDGVATLVAKGAEIANGVVVKLDQDVAVVVASEALKKAFPDVEYINGFAAAQDAFEAQRKDILAKSESFGEARDAVAKAAEDLNSYVNKLSAVLPESVFKAEQILKAAANGGAKGAANGDQETGDLGGGDTAQTEKDPLMPTKKADAGKNGTGEGFEHGDETGGDQSDSSRASGDDMDEEIDGKPGARVSGDSSGLPAKAKAPTKKAELKAALTALVAVLAKFDGDGDEDDAMINDDDSTNGTQSSIPAKAKAPTQKGLGGGDGGAHTECPTKLPDPKGESPAGEGAAQALDKRPEDNADADDSNAGGKVAGKRKGKTLEMEGIPAGVKAPTTKNDGDAEIGKKGKGKTLPDDESGAGAQEAEVQTLKLDAVMQAVASLAKSVQSANAAVTKTVSDLSERVEAVAVMAKKTDAALNGTVLAEAPDFDRQTWSAVAKKDTAPALLDTGYSRRTAR